MENVLREAKSQEGDADPGGATVRHIDSAVVSWMNG
jgi:hypothetical protein